MSGVGVSEKLPGSAGYANPPQRRARFESRFLLQQNRIAKEGRESEFPPKRRLELSSANSVEISICLPGRDKAALKARKGMFLKDAMTAVFIP